MKTNIQRALTCGLLLIFCMAGALVWTGCDTAGANDSLTITPSAAALSSGQSQQFTVGGGYQYEWQILSGSASGSNVTTSATGYLSARTGSSVVYTAPAGEGLSGAVTLRVTSTIEGSGSATSNSPAYEVHADAVITFK
jgi:hypothetical protein